MNEYETGLFFTTTAEDQQDCFFGEKQMRVCASMGQERSLLPGIYRVIDGQLCRVISGLSTEDVRNRLRNSCPPAFKESKMKKCDCKKFTKAMEWIDSCETLAWTHGMKYKLDFYMEYCAWCGKKLIEEKK